MTDHHVGQIKDMLHALTIQTRRFFAINRQKIMDSPGKFESPLPGKGQQLQAVIQQRGIRTIFITVETLQPMQTDNAI
ncbi:hypothetical protein DK871_08990 [Pseudomonas sp. L13]|nr:hypothetical protein [Pseudomonas sp. L13]